jgi:hypothetical protein
MRRKIPIGSALILAALASASASATAGILGPWPGLTGNDTGGIISYSPAIEPYYRAMAAEHCARWGRLSHITSVHRRYGDYIGFACIDKPWIIH